MPNNLNNCNFEVTVGMACAGSARSPDMLAPAVMPVTAGKKTENTVQNVWSLSKGATY